MTASPVFRPKPNAIAELFGRRKSVIGVIHLLPLPGSPGYDGQPMAAMTDFALAEAERYRAGGVDGLIVENHGDIPFAKPDRLGPETAACMAVITEAVRRAVELADRGERAGERSLGGAGGRQGCRRAIRAGQPMGQRLRRQRRFHRGAGGRGARYRAWLHAQSVRVFADVHVKHGAHAITADRSLGELARDVEFFDADVAIVTGQRTGDAAEHG